MRRYIVGGALLIVATAAAASLGSPDRVHAQGPQLLLEGPGSSIGVTVREVTPADAEQAGLAAAAGVVIETVQTGGPAEAAGLRAGDLVLEFDGERVRSVRQFVRLVRETPPRRGVNAIVVRNGSRQTVQVTPEAGGAAVITRGPGTARNADRFFRLPQLPRDFAFDIDPDRLPRGLFIGGRTLGVTVTPLSDQLAEYFGVTAGVLVSAVAGGSPAADAGIRAGDVITAVGGRAVNSAGDIVNAIRDADDDGIDISVTRDRKPLMLKATIPARVAPSGRGGLPV